MKNNNKKKIINLILVMLFIITLFGCTSNKGVSEEQIINDIQQSEFLQQSDI